MAAERQEHVMSPRHLASPLRIFTTEGKKKRKAIGRFIHKFTKSSSSKSENGGAYNSPDSLAAEEFSKWNQNFVDVNGHYDQDEDDGEDTLSSLIQKDSKEDDGKKMEKLHNPKQPSEEKQQKNTPVLTEETHGANNYKEQVYQGVAPKESDTDSLSNSPPKAEEYQKPSKPTPVDVNWNDQQPHDKNNVNNNHLTNNEEQPKHEENWKYSTDEYGGGKQEENFSGTGAVDVSWNDQQPHDKNNVNNNHLTNNEEQPKHEETWKYSTDEDGGGKQKKEEKLAGTTGAVDVNWNDQQPHDKNKFNNNHLTNKEEQPNHEETGKYSTDEDGGGGKQKKEEKFAPESATDPATALPPPDHHQEDSCVTSLAKGLQRMCGGGNK